MSVVVNVGGRDCIMHNPHDNENLIRAIDEKIHELDQPWGTQNGAGIMATMAMIKQLFKDIENAEEMDANTMALTLASMIYPAIKKVQNITASEKKLKNALEDFREMILEKKEYMMRPGFDQIFARLYTMLRFQDPIGAHDYFALFIDDFDKNQRVYEPLTEEELASGSY